jgi:hypothetical protein
MEIPIGIKSVLLPATDNITTAVKPMKAYERKKDEQNLKHWDVSYQQCRKLLILAYLLNLIIPESSADTFASEFGKLQSNEDFLKSNYQATDQGKLFNLIMELCNKNLDFRKEFEHTHDWQNNLHFPKLNSVYYGTINAIRDSMVLDPDELYSFEVIIL